MNRDKPIVLLVTTCHWFPVARLAMTLASSGFAVEAVCSAGHPLHKTAAVSKTYAFHGLSPLKSFRAAIIASSPDLVVPGDDLAAEKLHELYLSQRKLGPPGQAICALIEKSLGSPEDFPIVHDRTRFMDTAVEEGVRVPASSILRDSSELNGWLERLGVPVVLKANGTSGGEGVRIVRTLQDAERAFHALQSPPLLARAIKRAIVDHDFTLIWPSITRRRFVTSVQAFVPGHEATSLVACWKGKVLAALHFEVLNKGNSSGPSSVVRLIENNEMRMATEKMARRLNLSGLHGFDFMLDAKTGDAYLIEINPRATQVGHLTLGPGRDLPAALFSAVTGREMKEAPKITELDVIALFPQEWLRDAESESLKTGYHDVPWEESDFVHACINRSRKWRSAAAQNARIKAFWHSAGSPYHKSQKVPANNFISEQTK